MTKNQIKNQIKKVSVATKEITATGNKAVKKGLNRTGELVGSLTPGEQSEMAVAAITGVVGTVAVVVNSMKKSKRQKDVNNIILGSVYMIQSITTTGLLIRKGIKNTR